MSRYTVTAERSGKWWVLQAKEAPGAISQVARLDQADDIVEAIAFVTGEPEASIEIDVVPTLPAGAREHLNRAEALRREAAEANTAAADESRRAVNALIHGGLTLRDVGLVMNVSYQRAGQLAADARKLSPVG